jgi:general stress protein 26
VYTALIYSKHVNIAYDGSEKNAGWISIAGIAAHSNDKALVEKLYNPTIKAWFGDKGDGVHNGEPSDPRITVLEVTVQQIRHFNQQRTALGTVTDVIASTITGNVAQPGEIRQIEGSEIEAAWKAGELKEAGI